MEAKHVLGTITIVAIIGGTIYAIKKSKDLKKTEGEAITLEEARKIVDSSKIRGLKADMVVVDEFHDGYDTYFPGENINSMNDIVEDARDVANYNSSFTEKPYEDDEYEEEDEELNEIIPTDEIEEGDELRYEPNSREARSQFIKMELAEWRPLEDAHQTLTKLFEFPFKPKNDGDHDLFTRIIDYRVQFFGFGSRWSKEVTYADVVLYFARATEFEVGESVKYWAEYFLEFNEIDFTQPSHHIDEVLEALNSHAYFNEERTTFGLFGLTRVAMDKAIHIANRNVDRSVTYDIEFQEFLKSCI